MNRRAPGTLALIGVLLVAVALASCITFSRLREDYVDDGCTMYRYSRVGGCNKMFCPPKASSSSLWCPGTLFAPVTPPAVPWTPPAGTVANPNAVKPVGLAGTRVASDFDTTKILNCINYYREVHGKPLLAWSTDLQTHCAGLNNTYNCTMTHAPQGQLKGGENLATVGGCYGVSLWHDTEIKCWNPVTNQPRDSANGNKCHRSNPSGCSGNVDLNFCYGHVMIMLDPNAKTVGCAQCENGALRCQFAA